MKYRLVSLAPAAFGLLLSHAALAQGPGTGAGTGTASPPPTDAKAKAEAHDRFERAVRLFNDNDNAAALAEFQRVYELVPNPLVLYDIGLVYAALGRRVEAVDALDKLLRAPGSLAADKLERAKTIRAEQAARIATLQIKVNVAGTIEVDNIEVAKTPLSVPLKLASGTHIVTAIAPGYSPVRKEITIAGGTETPLEFELVPLQGRLGHLALKSRLPGADVVVDGQVVGRTPLTASLALAPGPHKVELRRPGYVTAKQDLILGEGSTGDMTIDLDEDEAALAATGGLLALKISEHTALTFVDSRPRGVDPPSLRLAPGVHHLRIECSGFRTFERDIEVGKNSEGTTTTVTVRLEPTAETLTAYTGRAKAQRAWGIVGIVAGAAFAGAGAGVLAWNAGPKSTAQKSLDTLVADYNNGNAPQRSPCNTKGGDSPTDCNAKISAAQSNVNSVGSRDIFGWVGIGVGAAALVTGVVVLATGGDPHRYDEKSSGERIALPVPLPLVVPHGGGVALGGVF